MDRAIASLFGAKPQETISSEAGRATTSKDNDTRVAAEQLCNLLNKLDPGHCQHAVNHADRLDKVDDGQEK